MVHLYFLLTDRWEVSVVDSLLLLVSLTVTTSSAIYVFRKEDNDIFWLHQRHTENQFTTSTEKKLKMSRTRTHTTQSNTTNHESNQRRRLWFWMRKKSLQKKLNVFLKSSEFWISDKIKNARFETVYYLNLNWMYFRW